MNNHSIAVLITCHNRRRKTLACLASLFAVLPQADVFLTDDGCTDGTAQEIAEKFPQVHIIRADGSLFWCGGMRLAWHRALSIGYDEYIWLNDDLVLYPFFYEEFLESRSKFGQDCIVTGLVEEEHHRIIYGGYDRSGQLIQPSGDLQQVYLMNGNVVSVPSVVVDKIGILDSHFVHDLGDVDYGLTAQEAGIPVISTQKAVALGWPNSVCRVRLWGSSIFGRFEQLHHPLGSPLKTNFYFRNKHFGFVHALLYCSHIFILNVLSDCIVKRIWGTIYIPG